MPETSIYGIRVWPSPPQNTLAHTHAHHATRTHTGRCTDLEAAAAEARALADKLQRDLQDLSGAYASLETHAADLEGRLAQAAGGAWGEAEREKGGVWMMGAGACVSSLHCSDTQHFLPHSHNAALPTAGLPPPPPPAPAAADEAAITARIDAAVAEAQKEADDNLNDLLVCLGQEERKVEVLSAKLVEMGVDADGLIAAAAADE